MKEEIKLDRILEVSAFAFSAVAFGYGALQILRKNVPKYFKLFVFAVACYTLEELWYIVYFFLAKGVYDNPVTVRLFGIFGCLCFMLSTNANEFDKLVDEWNNKKSKVLSYFAPLLLVIIYCAYWLLSGDKMTTVEKAIGFLSISPAIFGSYFSLKHLLLPKDSMGFLKITKSINILLLVFYAANFVYPVSLLYLPNTVIECYDLLVSVMLFGLMILCRKGADKWKKLI